MANNRMVIICTKCHSENVDWRDEGNRPYSIAKYYPGGWGSFIDSTTFNLWLEEHNHDDNSGFSDGHFKMVYEVEPDQPTSPTPKKPL